MAKAPAVTEITPTYDNLVGMVQRDLAILGTHLNQPVSQINAPACVAHLERMMMIMQRLPGPEAFAPPPNGKGAEARAS